MRVDPHERLASGNHNVIELTQGGAELRGMTLVDICRESVRLAGGRVRGRTAVEVVTAAMFPKRSRPIAVWKNLAI